MRRPGPVRREMIARVMKIDRVRPREAKMNLPAADDRLHYYVEVSVEPDWLCILTPLS